MTVTAPAPSAPDRRRETVRRLAGRVAALALTATGLTAPLVLAPPAAVAAESDLCVGALECVRFASGYNNNSNLTTTRLIDIDPVRDEPGDTRGLPWKGTFRLVQSESRTQTPRCLAAEDTFNGILGDADWANCSDNPNQRWYIEPVAQSVVTDPDSPSRWNPWRSVEETGWTAQTHRDQKFILRSTSHQLRDLCLQTSNNRLDDGGLTWCPGNVNMGAPQDYEINLFDAPMDVGQRKTQAEMDAVTQFLIGSAIEHGMEQCRATKAFCTVQLLDANNGSAVLSAPSRIDDVRISHQPVPVLDGTSCAGGGEYGSVQRIFNAGLEPMETSISVGGESAFENSVSHSFGVEVTAGISMLVDAAVTVSTSHEWGKTWSESTNFSQSVNWIVPPQRFATAVLSTSNVRATSKWRFGLSSPNSQSPHSGWSTDEIVDMKIPYADSAEATAPDSTMTVYNSLAKKSCSASAPSRLSDDAELTLTNLTAPDDAPAVGDRLQVNADPADFQTSASDTSPVQLAYRWYRVRAGEDPQLIQRANRATYTVTSDDVAGDADETETMGRYRLYATVTDVADQYRFDSPEYATLRTAAVVEEREDDGVGATELTARVLNPGASAGDPVRIELRAVAANQSSAAAGSVVVRVDGVEQAPVAMVDGVATFSGVLPAGSHQVDARFLPDTAEHSGAETEPFTVTVTGRASRTTLTVDRTEVERGTPVVLTARVAPAASTSHVPTGEVEFRNGTTSLGNPVAVDATGTARLTVRLPRGTNTVTAHYDGDDLFTASESTGRSVQVQKASSTVTASVDQASVLAGSPVRVNVAVTVGAANEVATDGVVQLFLDDAEHGSPVPVNALGRAQLQLNDLALGAHTLTLRYQPGESADDVRPAVSSPVALQVVRTATSLLLTADADRITAGQPLGFSAAVTNEAGDPVGSGRVQLFVDGNEHGNPMAVDATGRVRFDLTTLPAGARHVSARYAPVVAGLGDATSETLTVTVDTADSVVTLASARTVHGKDQAVQLVARTSRLDGGRAPRSGSVQLYVDGREHGKPLSVDGQGVARWKVSGLAAGKRRLMVRFTPGPQEALDESVSATVVHQVRKHTAKLTGTPSRTSVRVATKAKHRAKSSVVVSGRLRLVGPKAPGAGGLTVQVVSGGNVLGTAAVDASGRWSLKVKARKLQVGANPLQAAFAGSKKPSAGSAMGKTFVVTRTR